MKALRSAMGLDGGAGLEENTASFEIYPVTDVAAAEADLEALRAQLLEHVLPHLRGYIWQRDRFALHLSTQRQAPWQRRAGGGAGAGGGSKRAAAPAELPPHLWGSLSFGDNVEDEWFTVWLLLQLTRAFPVTARVWDNDGEFLLIEAAYGLPRWLKPETALNRLWLHAGAIHLVPLPRWAGDPLLGATPSIAQALAAVRGADIDTAAPPKLQAALAPRLAGYPGRAAEQMHVAHALVPARVAHLLAAEPQLLAAAVEAFHYRDLDDAKAAARMAAFPPSAAGGMVLVAPTFSRCLYAQLALQEFAGPRGYPMPLPSDPQYKAADVGMRLTAGFEMMLANRARFGRREGDEEEQQEAAAQAGPAVAAAGEAGLAGDRAWAAFRSRLEASGYFRGALPGSAQHSQLLAAAEASYRASEAYCASTAALAAPALRVEQLLGQPMVAAAFPPPSQLPPEGSEAWLRAEAGQQELDAELAARQRELEAHTQRQAARRPRGAGQAQQQQGGAADGEDDFDPGDLASRLRAFVEAASGLEGAELPGQGGAGAGGGNGEGADLDEDAFAAELQRVLGLGQDALRGLGGAGLRLDSDSGGESSDEGSSFYSGSGASSDDEDEAAPAAAAAAARQAPPAAASSRQQRPNGRDEQEAWEADTATDSDDDGAFMEAYGAAMDQQLGGTRMAESFERVEAGGSAAAGGTAGGAAAASASAAGAAGEAGADGDATAAAGTAALRPVDVDLNLVSSLLASYGEQQGLPGPAGTLAGLLGLNLPDPAAPAPAPAKDRGGSSAGAGGGSG